MENLETIKKRLEIMNNDIEFESDEDRKADKQAIFEMLEKMVLVIEKGGKKKKCKK